MAKRKQRHLGVGRMELLLLIASVALATQLLPYAFASIRYIWSASREAWLLISCVGLCALVGFRFIPGLINERVEERSRSRKKNEAKNRQLALKERREALERVRASRSRRLY